MTFDYKKAYKEFYLPPKTPGIITVPAMNFLAVRGQGDPNEEGGAYKQALELLYAVAFTSWRATSTMWCRPWRGFGGRRASRGSTTPTKTIFSGSLSSACQSL